MALSALIRPYNLYLQVLLLIIVFVSYGLQKKKQFRLHGITMLTAVVLHLISVIIVMIPSYINLLPLFTAGALDAIYLTIMLHGIIGILGTVLQIWIVASWRLRQSLKYCAPKKNMMRAVLILWVFTVVLAFLLYVL